MSMHILTEGQKSLLTHIQEETTKYNRDNISRTKAYEAYYKRNDEIKWAFLAGMVSRNAGWNMTDLQEGGPLQALGKEESDRLFLTYERANWLIFLDAYPQLLLYEYAKKEKKSLFHLLPFFHVSLFMKKEWERFMKDGDKDRLSVALIINEQHVIQKPVIEHPYFSKKVFHSFHFKIQEWFRMSYVVFPTLEGELYGFAAKGFRDVHVRIELGKRLVSLLFHPSLYPLFIAFASKTIPTGSRVDYEQYSIPHKEEKAPSFRVAYPIIPHTRSKNEDWYHTGLDEERWFERVGIGEVSSIRKVFLHKQKLLHMLTDL
jgi:Protein of unknown function (DUF2515)